MLSIMFRSSDECIHTNIIQIPEKQLSLYLIMDYGQIVRYWILTSCTCFRNELLAKMTIN